MNNPKSPTHLRIKNLTLAAIAGQAGCATMIIVVLALLLGLWLDSVIGQRGPFTFALICLSVPVSLYVMLTITLGAIRRISPPSYQPPPADD